MGANTKGISLGVMVGSRGFFNPAYAKDARKDIITLAKELGVRLMFPDEGFTPNGAVETMDDAKKYGAYFDDHRKEIDGIVILLANFGDEIAIVQALRRSGLKVPILLQACNDQIDKVSVKTRRDSYCGKISVTNNLYQYGIPWTDTTEHTEDILSDLFRKDLSNFVATCRTVKGLKTARIGAIGARPAPFQTMRYSEKLLDATGITVVTVDLSEILQKARNFKDDDVLVTQQIQATAAYGSIPARITSKQQLTQAKFSLAVQQWVEEQECDASAVQCWSALQNTYGCASCVTMSMMGEALKPSACEVDVAGAISMLALRLASDAPSAILDWNNNYGYEQDKVVCTHCGNYPKSFFNNAIEISELDILGETLGRDKCFGAVKGKVAPGDMTYFRMSTDDRKGVIKAYTGEGQFTNDPFDMDGGIAVCKVKNLTPLMKYVTKNGFEHHVGMVRGHVATIVEDAVGTYLGWDIYRHQ